jgi:hypothetical protein
MECQTCVKSWNLTLKATDSRQTTNKEYWACLEDLLCYEKAIIDA